MRGRGWRGRWKGGSGWRGREMRGRERWEVEGGGEMKDERKVNFTM